MIRICLSINSESYTLKRKLLHLINLQFEITLRYSVVLIKHVSLLGPLKDSGNYMHHLLEYSKTQHFAHTLCLCASYGSQNK
jgi:hypothetical protein